jgi:CheY-like chemotaxis protein
LIAEDLVDRGFDVSVAHDGQQGFTTVLENVPDLILCDVYMPVMSGFALAERLAATAPTLGKIPFVFLTAMTDQYSATKAQKLGVHVVKPIDFETLRLIIDARLAGRDHPEVRTMLVSPKRS